MHLLPNKSIKAALRRIAPTRIAVAYIGLDWEKLIDKHVLRQVILSPTLGSNPWAIIELQSHIGWEKIFFLDELHAKIYIGQTEGSIGSFNLSRNGFETTGLVEFGVTVSNPATLVELNREFENLLALARAKYPNASAKKKRLAELIAQWNCGLSNAVLSVASKTPKFINYQPLTSTDFNIFWWQSTHIEIDRPKLAKALPEFVELDLNDIASNWTTALHDDPIEKDTWILLWHSRADGFPSENGTLRWLYIHELLPNVVSNSDYTTLILQRKGRPTPPAPFSLESRATRDALKKCLALVKFKKFRAAEDQSLWSSAATRTQFLQFIEKAQHAERTASDG